MTAHVQRRFAVGLLSLLAVACGDEAPVADSTTPETATTEVPFDYGPTEQWRGALEASAPVDLERARAADDAHLRTIDDEDVLFRLEGRGPGDWFGWAVAALDDLDGDGVADFAVGAHQNENFRPRPAPEAAPGYVVVYSGADGSEIRTLLSSGSLHTDGSDDHFGYTITAVPDMDADGVGDVLVGAYLYDSGDDDPESVDENTGGAQIFSGASGALLHTLDGFAWGDRFAFTATTLPDMDGDDVRDLLIGVQKAESGPENAGCLQALSSATLEMIGSAYGPGEEAHLGTCTTDVGDVDGDGTVDIAGGAFKYSQPGDDRFEIGAAAVFNGRTGEIFWAWQGLGRLDQLGYAMAHVRDGDGRSRLAIGAPESDWLGNRHGPGFVQLVSCVDGATLQVWRGARDGDQFGSSVVDVGDRDGDGTADVAIGAPSLLVAKEGTPDRRGKLYLFSGADHRQLGVRSGFEPGDQFGMSVTPVADLDGDGLRELLVGAPSNVPGQTRAGYAVVLRGTALTE